MKNEHLGSNFDDFLEEEGLRAEAEAAAIKRVIAFQIEQEMKQANLSKTAMAEKMHTSRTALDRLLVPPMFPLPSKPSKERPLPSVKASK